MLTEISIFKTPHPEVSGSNFQINLLFHQLHKHLTVNPGIINPFGKAT